MGGLKIVFHAHVFMQKLRNYRAVPPSETNYLLAVISAREYRFLVICVLDMVLVPVPLLLFICVCVAMSITLSTCASVADC